MKKVGSVLVIGGGISGIQASLDLAESGFKVYLVERTPSIGGRMAQLDKTFPTNDCATCIMAPKMVEAGRHPNIELLTYSEILGVKGKAGNFRVKVKKKARSVDLEKCTGCGECPKECPVEVKDEFNLGLKMRKAIYRPFPQAVPNAFVIDKRGTPPCRATCPAGVNVQGYIALVATGKFKEALELIRRDIPFPAVCGRVCFHPCEADCERGKVDGPLAISAIKRFVADYGPKEKPIPIPKTCEEKVAIIGSGPAGITAAYELAKKGYPVTVFESLPKPGGMLRAGIPEYRLPKEVLDAEIEYIKDLGVEIRTNVSIGKELTIDELLQRGYKAIFVAVGAQKGAKLGIEGEELRGVEHALDFLRKVNLGEKVEVGPRVSVIGGGNVAIDAARTALRLGSKEVVVLYRRSRHEMPAYAPEVEEAEREGVKIHFLVAPAKVLGKDGRVVGIKCIQMRLGEPDKSGRRRPIPIEGSEFVMELDAVIPAIGQLTDISFLPKGVKVTRWNTLAVDPVTLKTSLPGVFAGGDVVSGPATVIKAIASGKRVAVSIDRYLRGEDIKAGREEEVGRVEEVSKEGVERKPRQVMPTLPLDQRIGNFREVELGFTREMATEEAKRCLFCGGCSECLECEKLCEAKAIIHQQKDEVVELNVGAIIVSTGYELFNPSALAEYGFGLYPNVLTNLQFERLLSPAGPTAGSIVRPSDDKEPEKIAFIQCVGSRDLRYFPYCSQVCCMASTKEAIVAKEHVPELKSYIFYMDVRAFGKGFQGYVNRARDEYGVEYVCGKVSQVIEDPNTHNLTVHYENTLTGRTEQLEVGLVLLAPTLRPSSGADNLAKILGIELDEYGFFKEKSVQTPFETTRPGIYIAGACQGPKDIPDSLAYASGAASQCEKMLSEVRHTLTKVKPKVPEKEISGEPRIGVFVCHCGLNIAGIVDVQAAVECAKTLPDVIYANNMSYTCSGDAQAEIRKAITEHNLNRVVVASCSPRMHEPLFKKVCEDVGLNPYLLEMANIREHCSWVHSFDPKRATEKAEELINMAVAKARLLEPRKISEVGVEPSALIIGGGVAGLNAVLGIAKQRFHVYLVEREPDLGGFLRGLNSVLPDGEDPKEILDTLIKEVKGCPYINIYLNSTVTEVEGFAGNFKVTIEQNGERKKIEAGAIVVATGSEELKPVGKYLYGTNENVMTQLELEKKLQEGPLDYKSVVMIQCVGARDETNPDCSRLCCIEAIKNAIILKKRKPKADVFVLFRDIMSFGKYEDHYRESQEKIGVQYLRYTAEKPPKVEERNGKLVVTTYDAMLGNWVEITADKVILTTPQIPAKGTEELQQVLKVPRSPNGFFMEAHAKLRPLEFASEGMYLCGLCQGPKELPSIIAQASGAASRACSFISKEAIETEAITAEVDKEQCIGCELCYRLCPYGALEYVEGKATVLEAICKGCGICAAGCPVRAIGMPHFRDEQILAQINAMF